MIRHANGWVNAGTLLLALASAAASAQEKSAWPVEQQHGGSDAGSAAAAPAMGGMQHGQMGGMNAGESSQGGMQHGAMGGMSQGSGGMGGMQHGAGGGGMMGGGMMGGMPAMSDQEKEDLLKKALELDLKLGQLRIRIAQASDETERERLKAEHRAVFKEYLPKLHKLMMQSHMESMKMQGGSSGQPMKH